MRNVLGFWSKVSIIGQNGLGGQALHSAHIFDGTPMSDRLPWRVRLQCELLVSPLPGCTPGLYFVRRPLPGTGSGCLHGSTPAMAAPVTAPEKEIATMQ